VCNSTKRRFVKSEGKGSKASTAKGAAMRKGATDGEVRETVLLRLQLRWFCGFWLLGAPRPCLTLLLHAQQQ